MVPAEPAHLQGRIGKKLMHSQGYSKRPLTILGFMGATVKCAVQTQVGIFIGTAMGDHSDPEAWQLVKYCGERVEYTHGAMGEEAAI